MQRTTVPALALASMLMGIFPAAAQMPPPGHERLQRFIELTQAVSPYRAASPPPAQWCYTSRTDPTYGWWYIDDVVAGVFGAVGVVNAFTVPFLLSSYDGPQRPSALIVGYAVDGGPPTVPLVPVAPPAGAADCAIGANIFIRAPHPLIGIAQDLALQTMVDPAPEYHYWQVRGKTRRVRFILAVPVAFAIGPDVVAGRIVIGFTSDG